MGMMLPTRRKPTNVIRPICNANSVDEPERSCRPGLQRFWNSGRGADCFVDGLSGYFAGRFGHERQRDDREMTRNRTVAHLPQCCFAKCEILLESYGSWKFKS